MAHDHHHHGESARDYFVEQLLTIFVVGSLGFVGIRMYQNGMLQYILAEPFRWPVFVSGVAVLALVAVRAVAVWKEAGESAPAHDHGHDHHHEHGPDCDHAHGPAADDAHPRHDAEDHDDHGHSHDLAWVFARMLVLFFPVSLFLIGVPNSGFSQDRVNDILASGEQVTTDTGAVAKGDGTTMSFNDLNDAAYDEGKREALQGQVGVLEGRFRRIGEKQFTLYRLKMTCCAADTVPLKVQIVTPTAIAGFNDGDWVRVKGEVRFVKSAKTNQYLPVVALADNSDLQKAKAQSEYD